MITSSAPAVRRNAAPFREAFDAFFSSRWETRQWLPPVNWKMARGTDPAPERSRPVASKTGRGPGTPRRMIGIATVPDAVSWHASVYVPGSTSTMSPGWSTTLATSRHGDLYVRAEPTGYVVAQAGAAASASTIASRRDLSTSRHCKRRAGRSPMWVRRAGPRGWAGSAHVGRAANCVARSSTPPPGVVLDANPSSPPFLGTRRLQLRRHERQEDLLWRRRLPRREQRRGQLRGPAGQGRGIRGQGEVFGRCPGAGGRGVPPGPEAGGVRAGPRGRHRPEHRDVRPGAAHGDVPSDARASAPGRSADPAGPLLPGEAVGRG